MRVLTVTLPLAAVPMSPTPSFPQPGALAIAREESPRHAKNTTPGPTNNLQCFIFNMQFSRGTLAGFRLMIF
jgi:hypothetical protein